MAIDLKAIRQTATEALKWGWSEDSIYPIEVIALCDEIERLTACLKKANDQAEHFEREWYLRGDRLEAAEKDVARLDYIESNCEGKLLRKYKKKWSFMPVCCNYEYPVFPNLRDALDYSMKDEQK